MSQEESTSKHVCGLKNARCPGKKQQRRVVVVELPLLLLHCVHGDGVTLAALVVNELHVCGTFQLDKSRVAVLYPSESVGGCN